MQRKGPRIPVLYYPEVWDDVEHTLFVCPHFREARAELKKRVTPENLGKILCGNVGTAHLANDQLRENVRARETTLRITLTTMITILTQKEVDERSRKVGGEGQNKPTSERKAPETCSKTIEGAGSLIIIIDININYIHT